ncbi:MAG TPA: amino acid adenylation domain-containing protein [Pyrinomonadaceae bacterium]
MSKVVDALAGLSAGEKRAKLAELLRRKASRENAWHPLSHGQQSLWFVNQLAPLSAAYNLMYAWRICSELDVPALQRSFQSLVDRHPSLRTAYRAADGLPLQQAQHHQPVSFEVQDASALSDEELSRQVTEAAHRPFALEEGRLLRVHLFNRTATEHVLLLTVHHIAADLPSVVTLMNEVLELYPAQVEGTPAKLPELKAQYADYIRWQSDLVAGEQGERLSAYWREHLAGELPILHLPADRPRPPVQTYHGDVHTFQLGEELTRRLRALARAEGVTLYMTLLAAFYVLLYRYTGQRDILVGSPAGSRSRAEFEGVVGYFVNPVVLRAGLDGDQSFREFLRQVRQTVLGALDHLDYPFTLLVEKLQPVRDASRSPLTDVMFILQRPWRAGAMSGEPGTASPVELLLLGDGEARMQRGGLELKPFWLKEQVSQVDLTLLLVETGASIFASLPYNTDLFDRATIVRLASNYLTLLEGIVTDAGQSLAGLPLMSVEEQRQVLVEWNDTRTQVEGDACLHRLFEAQVERTPERLAVISENDRLTYDELNRRANQLAAYLRRLGVGPEVLVGLCVQRSWEMIVGVLGILKAGGAYVPLDPAYPKERLAYMLEDARVPVLLTQSSLLDLLPTTEAQVICFETDWPAIAGESEAHPAGEVEDANLAYVIYTSGSTGKPKGVMIRHRSAVNLARAHQLAIYKEYAGEQLQVSLNAPLAFDGCVERMMLLLYGHTIHVWGEELRQDPAKLLAYLEQYEMDVLDFTPSQLRLLIEAGLFKLNGAPPRLALVGGEAIDEQLWQTLAHSPPPDVFNVYGPTECTVNAAVCRVKDFPARPTIGRPLANVQIYILNPELHPVPVGVPGEIFVGGAGLARGYHRQPALTAEKFVPHPFSRTPGARLYRTADLARYFPDGTIEFLGRIDDQVKIRGFRIELGEIEATLGECRLVKEAVVIAREDAPGDKRLTAYLVLRAEEPSAVDEIREFLMEKMPWYMIPSAFVVLDALPLTPNGKVNKQGLPAPSQHSLATGKPYEAPQTSIEEELARTWERLLKVERAGRHDNFFELGGHSLLATQLILAAREAFNLDLPLRCIFEAPTIAGLANKIIETRLVEQGEQGIEAMLEALEQLSDEEAQRLTGN